MATLERTILGRGRSAEVLAWQEGQVLKLFHEGMQASEIETERLAAKLVSLTDLSTPKLLGDAMLDGRTGLVYERVTGTGLMNKLGTRPWSCARYARQFAELHAAVHRYPGRGLRPLKVILEHTIGQAEGLPLDLKTVTLERLTQLPDGETLCHLDFHPDQVMLTDEGLVVLDWMNACSGEAAADVARTCLLLRIGAVLNAGWVMQIIANMLRGVFLQAYLRRYLEINPGISKAAVEAWLPVMAAARLNENITGEKERILEILRKSCFREDLEDAIL